MIFEAVFQLILILILISGIIVIPLIRIIRKWNRKRRRLRQQDEDVEIRGYTSIFPAPADEAQLSGEDDGYKSFVKEDKQAKVYPAAERLQKQLLKHAPLRRGILWAEILGSPVSMKSGDIEQGKF